VDLRFTLEQGGWTLRVAIDATARRCVARGRPAERVDLPTARTCRASFRRCSMSRTRSRRRSSSRSAPRHRSPAATAAHSRNFAGCEAKIQLAVPLQLPAGERRKLPRLADRVDGNEP